MLKKRYAKSHIRDDLIYTQLIRISHHKIDDNLSKKSQMWEGRNIHKVKGKVSNVDQCVKIT